MILTLEEAKLNLRMSLEDDFDDKLITGLIKSIPDYLETKTGSRWEEEPINPLSILTIRFSFIGAWRSDLRHAFCLTSMCVV